MALEQTIADLVSAANNLTSSVNGKMGEIDQAVDAAVAGIPAAVRKNMGRTVYLDQSAGSDSNDGTSPSKAFATMSKVGSETPAGSTVFVQLVSDYEFSEAEKVAFVATQVQIGRYGTTRKKLKFSYTISDGYYICAGFVASRNCSFNFLDLDIELPDVPAESGGIRQFACLISTQTTGDVPTPLSLRFANSSMTAPGGAENPFSIAPGAGMVILSTLNFSVTQAWVNAGKAFQKMDASMMVKAQMIHDSDAFIPQA